MAALWDMLYTMFGLDHLMQLLEWIKSLLGA